MKTFFKRLIGMLTLAFSLWFNALYAPPKRPQIQVIKTVPCDDQSLESKIERELRKWPKEIIKEEFETDYQHRKKGKTIFALGNIKKFHALALYSKDRDIIFLSKTNPEESIKYLHHEILHRLADNIGYKGYLLKKEHRKQLLKQLLDLAKERAEMPEMRAYRNAFETNYRNILLRMQKFKTWFSINVIQKLNSLKFNKSSFKDFYDLVVSINKLYGIFKTDEARYLNKVFQETIQRQRQNEKHLKKIIEEEKFYKEIYKKLHKINEHNILRLFSELDAETADLAKRIESSEKLIEKLQSTYERGINKIYTFTEKKIKEKLANARGEDKKALTCLLYTSDAADE